MALYRQACVLPPNMAANQNPALCILFLTYVDKEQNRNLLLYVCMCIFNVGVGDILHRVNAVQYHIQ